MSRQHRDRAMKSKLFGSAAFKNRVIETMIAGNINYDVNVFILDELFNCFMKIEGGYKIKLRVILTELL